MSEYRVEPGYAPYVVPADATFACVLRYTDRYVGQWHDDQPGNSPHYRYNHYKNMLNNLPFSEKRLAQIDIGCGAGLFSWVLLDWFTKHGVGHDQVNLYGFDHSQAMIKLAGMVRDELAQNMVDYPDLHYFCDIEALLDQLADNRFENRDYIITFGHVLVSFPSEYDKHQPLLVIPAKAGIQGWR